MSEYSPGYGGDPAHPRGSTSPSVPAPPAEAIAHGLIVKLTRVEGLTPKGILTQPFVFQAAPLGTLPISRSYSQTTYDTVGGKQQARPGVVQLRSTTFQTIFTDDPWDWTQLHGSGFVPDPIQMLQTLEDIGEANAYFKLTVRNPAMRDRNDISWLAALTGLNSEERDGEPDARYVTVDFLEYRKTSITTKKRPGGGSRSSKLPVKLTCKNLPASRNTLRELAVYYYGAASEWRRIAKANKLKVAPTYDLHKLGSRKITIPKRS